MHLNSISKEFFLLGLFEIQFNGSFTLSCSYEAVLTQGKEKHKFEGQHSSILATLFFTSIGGFWSTRLL